uniref:Uncharacterized protein n=1 Tax=viral metagenome TaxID=1070528 RepID=A0A6C0BMU4_9ZZZZ
MSLPYHRHSALNHQRGHQLFHDQVLQTFPATLSNADYAAGGYQADGTVVSWGKDCTIKTTDQYNMPTCCSTWASGRGQPGACCACGTSVTPPVPPTFFPVTAEQEFAAATNN